MLKFPAHVIGFATLLLALSSTGYVISSHAADKMDQGPAGKAYHDAMMKMDQDMMKGMTGNPDRDFALMMIPHHQGAIDMAKVLLQHGKDSELKKMAQETIPKQEKEISDLKRWLESHK